MTTDQQGAPMTDTRATTASVDTYGVTTAGTLGQPEQGEDEDYVEYLGRKGDWYSEHPSVAPPGFELVPCEAVPRHWPEYTAQDEDFYPSQCGRCAYDFLMDRHRGCAHSHHGAWRRWTVTGRVLRGLYSLGVVSGHSRTYSSDCRGCISGISWTKRGSTPPYICGMEREWWQCLRYGHWRRVDQYGLCTTCCPDPEA